MKSAVFLAAGPPSREGVDSALATLGRKRVLEHARDRVKGIVDETFVVVRSKAQLEAHRAHAGDSKLVLNEYELQSSLTDVASGLRVANGVITLILDAQSPFVARDVAKIFAETCVRRHGVVARRPDGTILATPAAFNTLETQKVALDLISEGETEASNLVKNLSNVLYFSTLALKALDPQLLSFFSVRNLSDLKKAEAILRGEAKRSKNPIK